MSIWFSLPSPFLLLFLGSSCKYVHFEHLRSAPRTVASSFVHVHWTFRFSCSSLHSFFSFSVVLNYITFNASTLFDSNASCYIYVLAMWLSAQYIYLCPKNIESIFDVCKHPIVVSCAMCTVCILCACFSGLGSLVLLQDPIRTTCVYACATQKHKAIQFILYTINSDSANTDFKWN